MRPYRMLALLGAVLITALVIVMITNDMSVAKVAAVTGATADAPPTSD